MTTRRKRVVQILVLLLGLLALFLIEEHFRGQWALAAWLKQAQAKGEKLDVDALAPAALPAEKNGAGNLIAAAGRFSMPNEIYALNSQVYVAPGRVMHELPLEDWVWVLNTRVGSWSSAESAIRTNAASIAGIHSALGQGGLNFNLSYRQGFSAPVNHLQSLRTASRILTSYALVELHEGRREIALAALLDAIALAKAQANEPLMISQSFRNALVVTALNATWQALQSPGWTDAQLAQLQKAWEGAHGAETFVSAYEMERAMVRVEFDSCRRSPSHLTDLFPTSGSATPGSFWDMVETACKPARLALRRNVYAPLWKFAWADQDELRFLQLMQVLIDNARVATARHSWAAATFPVEEPERTGKVMQSSIRYPMSSQFRVGAYTNSLMNALKFDSYRQMAITAIALQRYKLKDGSWPTNLSALVPQFASQVPIDCMDGQPLRYRLKDDGTFLLYSIGDLKDDGGDPSPAEQKSTTPTMFNGKDMVWPTPASAEEIARFQEMNNRPRGKR